MRKITFLLTANEYYGFLPSAVDITTIRESLMCYCSLQVTTITFAVLPTPPWERLLSHVVTTSEQDFGTVKEYRAFPLKSNYLFNSKPPLQ